MATRNELERFFGGIILLGVILLLEIISLAGLNVLTLLENIPLLAGLAIAIVIIVHFIPEKIYDLYDTYPGIFYLIYGFEGVMVIILIFFCHNKYFA